MSVVWVAGEALIDLVPREGSRTSVVGGGAANTAKALAKLGIDTRFVGGISNDEYGLAIREELNEVDLSLAHPSSLPTALAVVSLDESGSASYEFKLEGTASFDFNDSWLPVGTPDALHVGTLATVIEPGCNSLYRWASLLNVPIVYDPNIRPSVLGDREKYRKIVLQWASISKLVKLSEEDLRWLDYPNVSFLLDLGVELVVLTKGDRGLTGFTRLSAVDVSATPVKVVDTVGAGDTVGAILLEGVVKYGIKELVENRLFSVLSRAARAAAITCSRPGAKPPSLFELN